jgi:hypothetical protein
LIRLTAALSASLLVACGPPPCGTNMTCGSGQYCKIADNTCRTGGGTAQFRFTLSDMVKNSSNLHDPLIGTVHGNVFLYEDVTITGPRDGAKGLQDVVVDNVDLRTVQTSTANFITKSLEPNTYVFLGFFDLDNNGQTGDPDPGDPVTLALTNKFDIVEGMQAVRAVIFELVYN